MKYTIFLLLFIVSIIQLEAISFNYNNRFSLYFSQAGNGVGLEPDIDLNWLANADLNLYRNSIYEAKAYFSLQNRLSVPYQSKANHAINLYRGWIRAGSLQTSLRLGLQQLNFGSAQLYRPLQWFDYLNPLDLVDETKGVEAILLRHFFDGGANIWLWGIRGKDDLKGLELFPSQKNSIESGGRFQFSLWRSETALTFHSRNVKPEESGEVIKEYRGGLDVRTDSIFGFWLEAAGSYLEKTDADKASLQTMATLGLDYTFGWGNGMYMLVENAAVHTGETGKTLQNNAALSALMLDYPLSIFDKITLLNQYEWNENIFVQSLVFRRTYDHLSFQIMLTHDYKTDKTDSARYVQITVNYDI